MKIKLKAYAKINLILDVLSKLPSGYHIIDSVMQSVSLYDLIEIEDAASADINLKISGSSLMPDAQNTVLIAAEYFFTELGRSPSGLNITLKKNIPEAAGMAGGSADAAAVLLALNQMTGFKIPSDRLLEIGKKVGADVPFCMIGGTCRVEGIGEEITVLPPLPDCRILLVKEGVKASTGEMYQKIDSVNNRERLAVNNMVCGINNHESIGRIAKCCKNAFETVRGYENTDIIIGKLKDAGAVNAIMTGSGPTVLGIFTDKEAAACAYKQLKPQYENIYLTAPVNFGVESL